jgi:FkbH-like protein
VNFLEASRILANFGGGRPLPIRLAASGTVEPLLLYIRAAAAVRGRAAEVSTLPFGTLGQALVTPPESGRREVILLMPWDLCPECDWRSGIPADVPGLEVLLGQAKGVAARLSQRQSGLLYVPAPIPPMYADTTEQASLSAGLWGLAVGIGARVLSPAAFAIGNYLAAGVPIAGTHMTEVAEGVLDAGLQPLDGAKKVLATDLDNVLWAGLAAEEGPEGIQCGAEGVGFRHFLYQGLLARLKVSGVLLAAVSRNDPDVARAPIVAGKTQLAESDFVEILASYGPKSGHLRQLAKSLNLGLDAFVFVDDNPIELAEVGAALPEVACIRFPAHDDDLVGFFSDVAVLFARRTVSDEDRQRTEMYRRRLAVSAVEPVPAGGSDLTVFLTGLEMELTIFDRAKGARERAVQLINKTNQFNLNGRRFSDEEVGEVLAAGGRLFTARLDDRTGSHGEVLACLMDEKLRVLSFVLSCRVFQRRVEQAFVCWLTGLLGPEFTFAFAPTDRNTPIRDFLDDPAFSLDGDETRLKGARFLDDHGSSLDLFRLRDDGVV